MKGDAKAEMWFGKLNSARRLDPLLQYLYQARNDEEHHGLARSTERQVGHVSIGRITGQTAKIGFLNVRGSAGKIEVIDGGGHENFEPEVFVTPPHLILVQVRDRDRVKVYDPPTEHLGKPLEQGTDPIVVAELALKYAESLLAEADGY